MVGVWPTFGPGTLENTTLWRLKASNANCRWAKSGSLETRLFWSQSWIGATGEFLRPFITSFAAFNRSAGVGSPTGNLAEIKHHLFEGRGGSGSGQVFGFGRQQEWVSPYP